MVVLRLAVNVEHLLLLYTRLQRSYLVDHNCQACRREGVRSNSLPPSPPSPATDLYMNASIEYDYRGTSLNAYYYYEPCSVVTSV